MDEYEIKQMNDYAMSKWVNEMQIRNSSILYGTESVVVRLFFSDADVNATIEDDDRAATDTDHS